MVLKVLIEKGEDFGFVARAPALPGRVSQGATREVALANIREAVGAWLEVEQDKAEREGRAGTADVKLLHV